MADAVELALDEIANRLYENIIGGDFNEVIRSLGTSTKERIVKDYYVKLTDKLFDELNKEFQDVKFRYKWEFDSCYLNSEMHKITKDRYDVDYPLDQYDLDELCNQENDKELFYQTPLQEVNIKIEYYWERMCSLGCLHVNKRFYIVNMAKLLDLVSYHRCGMPVRTLVKEFIPDFFYDPTEPVKKKGRPRGSRNSRKPET